MPTGKELGPSRSAGPNYEYSCIHEPIVPHIVVPFKPMLLPHGHGSGGNYLLLTDMDKTYMGIQWAVLFSFVYY